MHTRLEKLTLFLKSLESTDQIGENSILTTTTTTTISDLSIYISALNAYISSNKISNSKLKLLLGPQALSI